MVYHICLFVEQGPICNSMAASLCLKSCGDHSFLKSYNGGLWRNNYRSGPCGSLISSRQEYPNLLQWGIWVPAQRSISLYDLLLSEASR